MISIEMSGEAGEDFKKGRVVMGLMKLWTLERNALNTVQYASERACNVQLRYSTVHFHVIPMRSFIISPRDE
jgi:hypothetical protein